MIQFNELKILPEEGLLIVDVSVKNLSYYTNVFIDKITIDTADTFVGNTPSGHPVYSKEIEGSSKSVRLEIKDTDILAQLKDNCFIVYVQTKGLPSSDTPCGLDKDITVSMVYDLSTINECSMKYLSIVSQSCIIPKEFIDFILRLSALDFAIKEGNITDAVDYWNKFFKNIDSSNIVKTCTCYGKLN